MKLAFLFLIAGTIACATASLAEEKPNFVVIFCDDLGYNDIGPFGSRLHRTPNLDRMAAEGRKFTSFYSTSGVCSPSRSSLMTGCYPRRVGLHQNEKGGWVLFPGNQAGLHPDEITVAEVLREAGYATACIGKWHLGDQAKFLPTNQGFDRYFGIPFSNDMGQQDRPGGMYPPLPLLRDTDVIEKEPDQCYLTKRYTEEAISFIEENKDSPFFLYLPHTMPHWPQYSSPRFAGRSANGAWGDTVEEIDWSAGQIVSCLEKLGIGEKTLVIFTSDNGGATRHGASNAPLSGSKGTTLEGGQRVCMVARWPGRVPADTSCGEIATTMDILPTFAALAGTSPPSDRRIDGHDISPLLLGEDGARTPHESFLYYYKGDLQAVRSGPWKLHLPRKKRGSPPGDPPEPVRLFHLERDIAEDRDVAADNPDTVKRLEGLAARARIDLGDDFAGVSGTNVRAPGRNLNAVPLTSSRERGRTEDGK